MLLSLLPQQVADTTNASTAYDSIWAGPNLPQSTGLESTMLSNDKLFVVMGVLLIIWVGIMFLILRTDRKLAALERAVEEGISPHESL